MKRHSLKVTIASLVLSISFIILVGCNSFSGTYYDKASSHYTLLNNGTCTFYDGVHASKGTYTRDGENIIIEIDLVSRYYTFRTSHEVFNATISGNTLIVNEHGNEISYNKK